MTAHIRETMGLAADEQGELGMETVGTIGAGTIGTGVAQALAMAGNEVILVDVSEEKLDRSLREMRRGLRSLKLLGVTAEVPDPKEVLGRITPTIELAKVAAASFVIENATENWAIKEAIYRELRTTCSPETTFGVNTSAIPITKIASLMDRPDNVVGMHFMNPVPMKPMVEVIRGHHTSDQTVKRARDLVAGMDKQSIVVNDSPGFVTNRVMMLTVNEAIFLLHEGVASTPEDIDRLFKTCFGHKMGPLETADLIGLDTVLYSIEMLYENLNDDKYRPCPLLRKMVSANLLGQKSGEGFYKHFQAAA
ncbi:MAG: 3-hydroxyacyl-CoA dehydrogenase NAD-binding domain-containing protein [Candidatus Binatia bacterium]|nr:3-hydroxyacyl-CoA dehydrogenase NAD-binding domain-containing protein [Candidatus Binatia bacterium]